MTANIGKPGLSANFIVSTQNIHINGLISMWLGKPSLPYLQTAVGINRPNSKGIIDLWRNKYGEKK